MLVSNSNVYIFHETGYKASSFRYIFVQFLCSNETHSTNFVILMKKYMILSDLMNSNSLIVTYRLQAKVYLSLLGNSHKKPCMFFSLKCCSKCLCVPPGTQGNKQVCPVYTITGRTRKEIPCALEILLYDSNSIIG